MNGQILESKTLGSTIVVTTLLDWGTQGEVYNTSHPDYLLKVCKPQDMDTPDEIRAIKQDSIKRYRTFSKLRFGEDKEVSCLPQEYFEVDYDGITPAYLMRRASGQALDRSMKAIFALSLKDRYRIARSLTTALNFVHSREVVHADFKPDNFFYDESGLIQILDIDGGGYFGNFLHTTQFLPSVSEPIEIYKAPELVKWRWKTIWNNPYLRKQPDLWSLAVLLYQILVDINGPFPTKSAKDDPFYTWFRAGDYIRDSPEWPRVWQKADMTRAKLDPDLYRLFEVVFRTTRRMQIDNPSRPDAHLWKATLDRVLTPIPLQPTSFTKPKSKLSSFPPPISPSQGTPFSLQPIPAFTPSTWKDVTSSWGTRLLIIFTLLFASYLLITAYEGNHIYLPKIQYVVTPPPLVTASTQTVIATPTMFLPVCTAKPGGDYLAIWLRDRPWESFDKKNSSSAQRGTVLKILGKQKNREREWLMVSTFEGEVGWTPTTLCITSQNLQEIETVPESSVPAPYISPASTPTRLEQ